MKIQLFVRWKQLALTRIGASSVAIPNSLFVLSMTGVLLHTYEPIELDISAMVPLYEKINITC